MTTPRLFTTTLWLVATMVSTAIVWTATSRVAADVTDRPAPVVPRREVISQLESEAAQAGSTTTSARAPATTTTRTPTTVARNAPPTTSPPTTQPSLPLPSPSTTAAARPPAIAPTTTQAPSSRPTATYSTSGGVVRVACDGFFIELLSATPADGYSTIVVARGPVNVEVHFVRFARDVSIKVVCFGQPIRYFGDPPTRS